MNGLDYFNDRDKMKILQENQALVQGNIAVLEGEIRKFRYICNEFVRCGDNSDSKVVYEYLLRSNCAKLQKMNEFLATIESELQKWNEFLATLEAKIQARGEQKPTD
jgi:hypothetical protein